MENLAKTIEPKSDQLNADDLLAGPLTVKIAGIKRGPSADQPVELAIDGHRPYRPCKSMRRVLIACWGDNGADWVGRSMTLYMDKTVKFGGVAVGGIRISHVSHIDCDISMMLTTTRSRRAEYRVKQLTAEPAEYPAEKFEANLQTWVAAVSRGNITVPDIIHRASSVGRLTSAQIEALDAAVNAIGGGA